MRFLDNGCYYTIKLSANDTYDWAHKSGACWPCSTLSGRSVWAQFDRRNGDLVDTNAGEDVDGNEFNALFEDAKAKLRKRKPLEVI